LRFTQLDLVSRFFGVVQFTFAQVLNRKEAVFVGDCYSKARRNKLMIAENEAIALSKQPILSTGAKSITPSAKKIVDKYCAHVNKP